MPHGGQVPRSIFVDQKIRMINPVLSIETAQDADWLFDLVAETVMQGRMIDFGHLPNDVLKEVSPANRQAFEAGEFTHPYESWVGCHRWEGGFSAYWFGPHPGDHEATCAIEMYGVSLPEAPIATADAALVIYDIVSMKMTPEGMRCWAFPLRPACDDIPEMGRIANSLDPLVVMLTLLHDASVPVTHSYAPVKLNRQRAKGGKAAIPARTVVHTEGYVTAWRAAGAARKPAQGGHHASPIAHTRRAHQRLLASGRVVPVRSSKVNWRDHEEVRRMFYKVSAVKNAVLIDPKDKTVQLLDLPGSPDLLEAVREAIGAPQIAVVAVPEQGIAVFVDAMGILKPGRCFWRFKDSDYRFAGRAVVTAIDLVGVPRPLPDDADMEPLERNLIFEPSELLDRIGEKLIMAPDEEGRMVPTIFRQVLWTDRPAVAPPIEEPPPDFIEGPPEISGWSVFEGEHGYQAIELTLRGNVLVPTGGFGAPSLEELRKKLPPGLVRIEPSETDSPELVEHWHVPTH